MTNADRIRKMTDEELCRFLIMVECNDLHYDALPCEYCELVDTSDCDKCVKKWLKRIILSLMKLNIMHNVHILYIQLNKMY